MVINDSGRNGIRLNGVPSFPDASQPSKRYLQDPIAVVGMGCRLPGNSNSSHALWEFLERGGIAGNFPPESRFRVDTHHDGSKRPKTMRSPGGMFLENIDPKKFDAAFFGIGKIDAITMDPQQRQLLEVVYECLENAGIPLEKLDGEAVGCFVSSYAVDYADIQARDPDDRAPSVTIGVGRSILSNRISHFLNIHGPSMTIDTACSGSLVGLDVACHYLASGEINGALVAGANLYLSPEHNMDSGSMKGASSLSGRCHTFDKKADGYIKAEAINCVMLKRLSDAERDGDPIRAIIRGTATNSDGKTPGIASPSSEAQAMATRAAYANAGITDFSATGYIEMHGTGTQAGDPQEVKGVASVFAASRSKCSPLIMGSIKSNIGHSGPAAGISGLMKAILAVEKGRIPGNPTFIDPNPNIYSEGSRVRTTRYTISWPAQNGFRRASVNSFGYGGSNAHIIIDQVPNEKQNFISSFGDGVDDLLADEVAVSRQHVLLFSANDESSIKAYTESLRKHLLNPRVSVELSSLAYTLSERRTRNFHRGYIVTKGLPLEPTSIVYGKKKSEMPRIGFIFTGQGAQWSQMGRSLIQNFVEARAVIERLDKEPRKASRAGILSAACHCAADRHLRVFRTWGIHAEAAVGHSSGEIAAAYAAGLLSEENAIKAAYYRGYAATATREAQPTKMGMMAVGLGAQGVRPYIAKAASVNPGSKAVSIACYNSPNSVTLSGTVDSLDAVRTELVADKHFARMLQVDMAYHSPFMGTAGKKYVRCLEAEAFCTTDVQNAETKMFSSMERNYTNRPVDIAYWKSNMVQPVLFEQALKQMLSGKDSPNFLIEIGPSGALAGPTSQVKKELPGGGSDVQYCSAMTRGKDAENAIFDVAGRLFVAGHNTDFTTVNNIQKSQKILTDLPNYAWNHGTDYWYESEASQDWRNRKFPHHDLLGSKVLGTAWQAPVWKKTLKLEDLPWLKDHRLGPEIVFPGAGYMCMAIEAMMQTDAVLRTQTGEDLKHKQQIRLRNVSFDRALVLEEGKETRIMLTLTPFAGQKDSWYSWVVRSLVEGSWIDHCKGQVRIEKDVKIVANSSDIAPLQHPSPGTLWYKSMSDVGYNFGKSFQKLQFVETTSGPRQCRSQVHLNPPASEYLQSEYPMHPAAFDGCMQSCAPGLWRDIKSSVNAVLVPAIIDDVVIRTGIQGSDRGISVSQSLFAGPGRTDMTKNYSSNTKIYDPETGNLIFKLTGLRYHMIDFQDTPYAAHLYSRLVWGPDVTLSPQASDLIVHKKSNAKVVEALLMPQDYSSVWLEGLSSKSKAQNAFGSYSLLTNDASAVVAAQSKYEAIPRTTFQLLDLSKPFDSELEESLQDTDLFILRLPSGAHANITLIMENVGKMLRTDGHLLLLEQSGVWEVDSAEGLVNGGPVTNGFIYDSEETFKANGFDIIYTLDCAISASLSHGYLAIRSMQENASVPLLLDVVHFSKPGQICSRITEALAGHSWDISEIDFAQPLDRIRKDATILVISELETPQLPILNPEQWTAVQQLLQMRNRIMWVSKSAQWQVTNPDGAMIHGLCRSVRTEDPSMKITTLDLEDPTNDIAVPSINLLLKAIQKPSSIKGVEGEYVERGGIFHISLILGDDAINAIEHAKTAGAPPVGMRLHEAETTVRMIAERVGFIDSLHYVEVDSKELPLPDNKVEVELFASALNFKDVAVTMGIVPENHHLLGLEGAGTIRRVGANLNIPFHIGQRVLVFEKRTFANRIIATTERTIAIPDWLSYEEAATLPSVYLTSLYSLFNLADLKKGDRVLIHSATGGLGIASIQICHAVGAEVYATVGQEIKKQFLMESFGIPQEHIFNSRNIEFEGQIMEQTNGYGVDIILNSLTGDLLDASWRCIAEGGTMVELGKKDHIDRNTLAMEPFARNASYRCFDMSHRHVSDEVIAILMSKMMHMIISRVVKPISPVKLFPYSEIPSALRILRSANHIGKIIISNKEHADADPAVPVRPALRKFRLRGDVSYLIVGGLKGLCGSLAVDMARHGARNVVILGRSGYDDPRSQTVLKDPAAEGCHVDLIRGDVSRIDHVRRVFQNASKPVGGIIQGAMVLRDKPFEIMTHDEYHTTITSKVAGTWNLHSVALEMDLTLDFFTMSSSISGLIGQPAQANYAAANVFLDNFAYYRRGLSLKANSVDLGAIEDVGYMAEHSELITALDTSAWTPINESLFHKIVQFSIMQQEDNTVNTSSCSQLITSIAVPQAPSSRLLVDARFSSLLFGSAAGTPGSDASGANKEIQSLLLLIKSGADIATALPVAVEVVNKQFMTTLRVDEPLERAKPLSAYGLDSLAAVELRNWSRAQLGAELTTLEVTSAPSLLSLAEKIVIKIQAANVAK
ncbi:ketoacyl-synt-domain-containing protein [Zopfia rhizophila CBS 207.26]|uniref:Ketoacyl-synt-domain-containing protein n=1 Tax=Zopfia rhizophila CBS 207.26 TaxID=1314779 RepID=A0A6A6DCR0_9PEZI|nr:ketoacyl-synt-domain-containing protein [Zopfia rhizophila CBS 207.26]